MPPGALPTLAAAAAALCWLSSATLVGDHVCRRKEQYNVTMKILTKEPVTYRTYVWCVKVPPRCSKYHTEMKDIEKIQTVPRDRVVEECCEGYSPMEIPGTAGERRCEQNGGLQHSTVLPDDSTEDNADSTDAEMATPYWEQLRQTGTPPPLFSGAAEVSVRQEGGNGVPKKDTRLGKKDRTAHKHERDKVKDRQALLPMEESSTSATIPPSTIPSPPPLPPELGLPPQLDLPPVPAISAHNQSLAATTSATPATRSGRRRRPPSPPPPPPPHSSLDLTGSSWAEEEAPDSGEELQSTTAPVTVIPAHMPPNKDILDKGPPRKKASDVKDPRKSAPSKSEVIEDSQGTDSATEGRPQPEEGSWEPWGWQPAPRELQPGGGREPEPERRYLSGLRKAAHAKRGRGEDLKASPMKVDGSAGLLVMAPATTNQQHDQRDQEEEEDDDTVPLPVWAMFAIGGGVLMVVVVVSVSAAILSRGRRPEAAAGGGVELRPVRDSTVSTGPLFLSPVFVQSEQALEAVNPQLEAAAGGGSGGGGLFLAAVLSPQQHATLCRAHHNRSESTPSPTYDVPPPPTLRPRDSCPLQLQHMCTTPPPAQLPPPVAAPTVHVYEELPCWQRAH